MGTGTATTSGAMGSGTETAQTALGSANMRQSPASMPDAAATDSISETPSPAPVYI